MPRAGGNALDLAAEVEAWLERGADEMAGLLEELVAIDSENPPGRGLGRCGRLLRDVMTDLGLAPELIELSPSGDLEEPCLVRGSVGAGAPDGLLPRALRRRAGAVACAVPAAEEERHGSSGAAAPT